MLEVILTYFGINWQRAQGRMGVLLLIQKVYSIHLKILWLRIIVIMSFAIKVFPLVIAIEAQSLLIPLMCSCHDLQMTICRISLSAIKVTQLLSHCISITAAKFNNFDFDVFVFSQWKHLYRDGDTNLEPSVFADIVNPVFLVSDSLHWVLLTESLHQGHSGPWKMKIILCICQYLELWV